MLLSTIFPRRDICPMLLRHCDLMYFYILVLARPSFIHLPQLRNVSLASARKISVCMLDCVMKNIARRYLHGLVCPVTVGQPFATRHFAQHPWRQPVPADSWNPVFLETFLCTLSLRHSALQPFLPNLS